MIATTSTRRLGVSAGTAVIFGLALLIPLPAQAASSSLVAEVEPVPLEVTSVSGGTVIDWDSAPDPTDDPLVVSWGSTIELRSSAVDVPGGLFGAGPDGDWDGDWESRGYDAGTPTDGRFSGVYIKDYDTQDLGYKTDVEISGTAEGTSLFVTLPDGPVWGDWDGWEDEEWILKVAGFESCTYGTVEAGPLDDCGPGAFVVMVPLTLVAADAGPAVSLSKTSLARGGTVAVSGSGFEPNESIEVWMHSTPVRLTSGNATAGGAFAASVTIPAGAAPGAHQIELRGASSGSTFINISVQGGLADTGSESLWLIGLSGILIAAGAPLLLIRRRMALR